jgi:KAP family P-loop domain
MWRIALQILERVKHFFAVPRVHFVLGAHLAQLQNSVMVAYGAHIDALNYLQKFIHLTLHLVDTAIEPSRRVRTKYIQHLLRVMQFSSDQTAKYAEAYYRHVAERRSLSLRAIERVLSTLAISLTYKPRNLHCPTTILVGLCLLKITDPALYVRAKEGTVFFDELRVPLGFAAETKDETKHVLQEIAEYWLFCTLPSIPKDSDLNRFSKALNFDQEREHIVPLVANEVIDRLTPA